MKIKIATIAACFLCLGQVAYAHRLDEYLQATMISVQRDRVLVSMRLIPGVAVASAVIERTDSNGDGVISEAEQRFYAERMLASWSIKLDGLNVTPRLVSVRFPGIDEMKEGLGEIHIETIAVLPHGAFTRKLTFQKVHPGKDEVYLVNCLAPDDQDIQVVAQSRNQMQSFYQLDYVQTGSPGEPTSSRWWSLTGWTGGAGFASLFHLGLRHIAEGTDHLLFLLALLLPAPVIVCGSRWAGPATVRQSLIRILQIVTAFTVGHSITLALAAMRLVSVPSRPIEVLIAVSILVSAIHALRPLLPGKEAAIAAFFGLIHGLAFAATLNELGLDRWQRIFGILAFNLGIETMQLVVVGVTLPSLILLSRTRRYTIFRVGGATFAGCAAVGWIAERLTGASSSVDLVVNRFAQHAPWFAAALFFGSFICRRWSGESATRETPVRDSPTQRKLAGSIAIRGEW